MVARVILAFAAGAASSAVVTHALRRKDVTHGEQLVLLMQQDAGGQSARGFVKHPPACVTTEASTSYGGACTATAVEVQGNGSKALLIDVNGATKAGAEAPHSTWLKPLSAAMLTCCALAAGTHPLLKTLKLLRPCKDANTVLQPSVGIPAGTLSHELQSGKHDWLRIYLSVASLLVAGLAALQLLVTTRALHARKCVCATLFRTNCIYK